jgi:hypothetical protein
VAAILAVAVLVLVTLAALGARGLPGSETRPPPFLLDIDVLTVARIMLGILAGLAALLLILLLLPGGPPIKLPERKKSSPMKLLAGIVMLFAVLLVLQPFVSQIEQEPESTRIGDATTRTETSRRQPSGSRWGLIILGGAVLLVVWGVAAATRPAAEQGETAELPAPAMVAGVIDSVLAELEESSDPRKVVIGAYARMERVLTVAGLPRRVSEAPHEYLARSLRRLQVSRPAISRLTRLFEVARFSHHEILPDMGRQASAALSDIRNELSGVMS